MQKIVELILNSALLWIFIQALPSILFTILYEFCIPWIIWGSLIIMIVLKFVRISPPAISIIQEVLGINPLLLLKDNSVSESNNGDKYCMRVVAHRGGGYDYPENSLLALRNVKLYILK